MFLVCKVLVQFCRLLILSWVEWVIIQNCCDLGGKNGVCSKGKMLKEILLLWEGNIVGRIFGGIA